MAFPMRGARPGAQPPPDDSEAPGGMMHGAPAGPSPIHTAHKTIHHHLRAAHALVKSNPAKAQQHINAAGIAATAMHNEACPDCGPGADADDQAAGPGTMNAGGGAYGGQTQ